MKNFKNMNAFGFGAIINKISSQADGELATLCGFFSIVCTIGFIYYYNKD